MRALARCPLLTRVSLWLGRRAEAGNEHDAAPISVFAELGAAGLGRLTSIKYWGAAAPAPGERLPFLQHCSSLRSIDLHRGGVPLLPETMTSLTHMAVDSLVGPIPPAHAVRLLARLTRFDVRVRSEGDGVVVNELLGRLQSVTRVRYGNVSYQNGPLPRSLSMLTTLRSVTYNGRVQLDGRGRLDLGPVAGLGRLTSLYIRTHHERATVHVPPVPSGVALPALRELFIRVSTNYRQPLYTVELPLFSRAVAPRLCCLAFVCGPGTKPQFNLAHLAQRSLRELRVLYLERMTIDVGDDGAEAADVASRVAAALPALAVLHLHDCTVKRGSKRKVTTVLRGKRVCRSRECSLGRRVNDLFEGW